MAYSSALGTASYAPTKEIGVNFSQVDSSPTFSVGTIVQGRDDTYGTGEFVYGKGVASVVAGDGVTLDTAFQAARIVNTGRGLVGVAMAAIVANTYGWFQISGQAVGNAASSTANGAGYGSTTTGSFGNAGTNGKIENSVLLTALNTPATGKAVISLAHSVMVGSA